ncbi:MAG: fasciclin domain-containing protein [Cyanobacteria bacterium P01_C01_bin.89]
MATIVDIAVNTEGFSTLVAAVQAAGLVETLQTPGPFTVFAPNDDAFAKLPPGTVQTLVQNPPQLARILTFHVVAGKYTQAELLEMGQIDSIEGAPIPVRTGLNNTFEVKNATVLAADIEAENGIIHVLDNVILMG